MQNKIVVKHSRIEIHNYDLGDCPRLEYFFTLFDKAYFRTYFKAMDYNAEKKILYLPRGLDINYIENLFCCDAYVDMKHDDYINTKPIPIKYKPKDQRQLEILKFLLGTEKYTYTSSKSQLSVNATTGAGKTFVTIATMCYTGSRMIIIANKLNLIDQWRDKILEYTPLTDKNIYKITGSTSINRILVRDPLNYNIFLVSHSTIRSYGDNYGWDKVDELFKHLKCSIKVYDEAHLYFDNIVKIDFHSNTKKTIYLTATPKRSSEEEDQIYQLYFKNVPSISLFDEDKDPHVNYVALHYNTHPSPLDIDKSRTAYGFNRNGYVDYVIERPNFKEMVILLVDIAMNINGKVLIYIGTNKGIKSVYNFMIETFPFLEGHIGIYTSIVSKEEKEQNLHKKIILSTTKSCGEASDIYALKCTVNLAEPFKTSVLTEQTLGRCRADNSMYIDMVDQGFYHTKKYYKEKKPIFSRLAKSCKDVSLDDEELNKRSEGILEKYSKKKVMCMPIYNK